MYKKKTSAQLKQLSRGLMMGKYPDSIAILIASNLILNALLFFTPNGSSVVFNLLTGVLFSIVLTLIETILSVGQCSFYLNIACGADHKFTDLFTGFKVHPDKSIFLKILTQLLSFLPLLPALILSAAAIFNPDTALLLPLVLLLVSGCIFSLWISIRLSQVYYLLLDFPDTSVGGLIKKSWHLMSGNSAKYLYLKLSFLPITLAGILSFGIGLLFVSPYRYMTETLFYLDMMVCKNTD